MSDRFTSLVRTYAGQLLLLTRRIYQCSPLRLAAGIPLVLVNQVSFILALMLPLKVIIMLGSDGVPRYFRFFMTEETRMQWMVGLAFGAVGFFVLYAVTDLVLGRLAKRGGERLLTQSRKTGLFDRQEEFAGDIFRRVVASWGTLAMVVGGMALGLLLEWRLVALLLGVILLEFLVFVVYWNRFRQPERASERERLAQKRANLLRNLSAINVLIFFGGLVVLLLTDPTMNFIIALVLFILTRQILARATSMFGDANFFLQNREKIDALVHPGRHLREKRAPATENFEQLLMPDRRASLISAVMTAAGMEPQTQGWEWRDLPGKGVALFVLPQQNGDGQELRLKLKASEGDAALAREEMFYRSDSARKLGMSCELVHADSIFGRGYILLRSDPLGPCPHEKIREIMCALRMRLWQHRPDQELASRLLRSFPALDARLTAERLGRIRVACNGDEDEAVLDELLGRWPAAMATLGELPRVLSNQALGPPNLLLNDADEPVVLNWDAIRFDLIGSDLAPGDLKSEYAFEKIAPAISGSGSRITNLPDWGLPLVMRLSHIDRLITQEAYGAALAQMPSVLELLEQTECAEGESPAHASSQIPA